MYRSKQNGIVHEFLFRLKIKLFFFFLFFFIFQQDNITHILILHNIKHHNIIQ